MDARGRITDWNQQAEQLFGWAKPEVLDQPLSQLIIPARLVNAHHAGLAHFHATGKGPFLNRRMTVQALHRDGHEITLEMTLTALQSADDCAFFAFLHDASAQVPTVQALIDQAMQDPLTGLANRRSFILQISKAISRTRRTGRPIALLYMDIDHFKSVNDGLGHAIGDALLQAFGTRLKQTVRETDLVSRLGGDEFAVILEELTTADDAGTVAAKLVAAMAERFELAGQAIRITTSIGLQVFEGGDMQPDRLINRADQAMYQAKRAGRDTWRALDDDAQTTHVIAAARTTFAEFIGHSPTASRRRNFFIDALAAIRVHLDMQVAFISEFTEGRRVFRHIDAGIDNPPIQVGAGDPLEDSYCQRVVDGRLPELIPDAFAVPEAMAMSVTQSLPVRAHVSVPIRLSDGRIYGTFCCFSPTPDISLNERDLRLMHIFADMIARHIERNDE